MNIESKSGLKSAPKLKVEGLRAGYGSRVVLHDVGMEVAAGEIRVILGSSGCGKSTLLKNIIGLEKPISGSIHLFGQSVDWFDGKPTTPLMRRIGVLFQGGALLSSLSVGENVSLPLRIHNPGLPKDVVEDLVRLKLNQVKMGGAYHKLPNELSGGMRKRAGLARAIVTDPELLFCDEPSAGLDPVTSRELDDLLLELKESLGITMIVVTHELDSIRTISDRLTFLSGGHVIFDGTMAETETVAPKEVKDFLARKSMLATQAISPISFTLENP
jgi:phospholipid/cholesterol/gamma-HCH transport system ATP-binding protein